MSDNPGPPRRPLGGRDEKDKSKPFGGGFGKRPSGDSRPKISPTDPYPWAKDEEEDAPPARDPNAVPPTAPYPWADDEPPEKPAPPPADPNRVPPTAPYPWANDEAPEKPAPPPADPNRVAPTAPYPWADDEPIEKPTPRPDPNRVAPTAPYPWADDEPVEKPTPRPDPNRVAPTAPYPWAGDEPVEKPTPRPDPNRVAPTAPYPWAGDEPVEKPTPRPDPNRVAPTAPYSWARGEAPEKPAPRPDPNRIDPTAPYPWSDEAPPNLAPAPPPAPARPPAPIEPAEPEPDVDPRSLSWADLIAGVDRLDAAPPEADLLDEAPLEPPLPSEAPAAERPRISDAARSLPTEREAPPERVTDRFLKRGAFLKRSSATAIPARSYLESDAAPPPEPIVIQIVPLLRTLGVILGSAFLVATLFTWWTPNSFLPTASAGQLAIAEATQGSAGVIVLPQPTSANSNVIGIVSGHKGINPSSGLPDPGAVCEDGLTEESVNATIATKTAQLLEAEGYHVDVFDEFDKRLTGYHALVMVSIHADSCEYINDEATGFKVASFQASSNPERDSKLVNCVIQHYAERTGLPLHPGVTFDMTDYHNFREIDPATPGIIVETGFLYLDRNFLTGRPDDAAHGIADGVLCYLHGEAPTSTPLAPVATPTGTEGPTPTATMTPTDSGALFDTATPVDTPLPPDQITYAP